MNSNIYKMNKIHKNEIDKNAFVKVLEKYKEKVSKSEKTSKAFLVDLGVITQKGNLTKNYKDLCIPVEQE